MADPADPEVSDGPGFDILALLAFLPYVISFLLPKIRGAQAPPLDPPLDWSHGKLSFEDLWVAILTVSLGASH